MNNKIKMHIEAYMNSAQIYTDESHWLREKTRVQQHARQRKDDSAKIE